MAGRKYLGPYSDSDDIATKAKVDAAATGSSSFYVTASDDNTYTTTSTSYVTVVTVSLTMPSSGLVMVSATAQTKSSGATADPSYMGVFFDSTQLIELSLTGGSYVYVNQFYTGPVSASSGSHYVYIKHRAKSGLTNYIKNIRVVLICIPS